MAVSNKIVFPLTLTLSLSKGMVRQAHHLWRESVASRERLLHNPMMKVE